MSILPSFDAFRTEVIALLLAKPDDYSICYLLYDYQIAALRLYIEDRTTDLRSDNPTRPNLKLATWYWVRSWCKQDDRTAADERQRFINMAIENLAREKFIRQYSYANANGYMTAGDLMEMANLLWNELPWQEKGERLDAERDIEPTPELLALTQA